MNIKFNTEEKTLLKAVNKLVKFSSIDSSELFVYT